MNIYGVIIKLLWLNCDNINQGIRQQIVQWMEKLINF